MIKQYIAIDPDICGSVKNVRDGFTDLKKQIHKQEEIHYAYVESNETHVSEIEQQLRAAEESLEKLEESIKRNSICIKILIAGLFCTGVAILALIYHVITI